MIYDFLFFKAYKQVIKSRNFDEFPMFGASMYVTLVLMFNILSILFVLDRHKIVSIKGFTYSNMRYAIPILILSIVWLYYRYVVKHSMFIQRMEEKNNGFYKLPGWVVFFIYYFTSGIILLLAGMYMNHDWIFK